MCIAIQGLNTDIYPHHRPAYKGIPLATTTLLALRRLSPSEWSHVSYSFNRKEAKSHGEGGSIVGSSLRGKNILVLDDVVTAGTAMSEAISIVEAGGGSVIGFVVALDRMERMPSVAEKEGRERREGEVEERGSAMGMVRREFGVRTVSVVTLDDLVVLLKESGEIEDVRRRVEEYRERYKASD
jgi:orotate phosphoribosyltransferase